MRPDRETIVRIAADRRFNQQSVEKVLCMLGLLREMHRHPYLGPRLVLKGGTALNLFHWDCPRLSVDIDLNYVGAVSAEEMDQERAELLRAIERVCRSEGYRVQYGRDAHASTTMHLRYLSALGAEDRVQLDVNFLMRVCLFEPELRSAAMGAEAPKVEFSVAAFEEIMAGKLVALLDRRASRDLYDTYRFVIQNVSHDERRLRQAFIVYATAGLPRPLWDYDVDRLERFTDEQIARELWPVLAEGDRPSVEGMRAAVAPLVSQLLDLRDEERRFAEAVLEGESNPRLLSKGDEMLETRIASHPALLWKLANVRRWRERNQA